MVKNLEADHGGAEMKCRLLVFFVLVVLAPSLAGAEVDRSVYIARGEFNLGEMPGGYDFEVTRVEGILVRTPLHVSLGFSWGARANYADVTVGPSINAGNAMFLQFGFGPTQVWNWKPAGYDAGTESVSRMGIVIDGKLILAISPWVRGYARIAERRLESDEPCAYDAPCNASAKDLTGTEFSIGLGVKF